MKPAPDKAVGGRSQHGMDDKDPCKPCIQCAALVTHL